MQKNNMIYVAGHRGMVGCAIVKVLQKAGYENIVCRNRVELDLRNQQAVNAFFAAEKPAYVFMAAAKVGGIMANSSFKADFMYDNLLMEANVIDASYRTGVKKMLFLGSSCIYPKLTPQPLKEEYLLTGLLEPSNEPYAIAKIAGIKLCDYYREQYGCNFISAMPTNLYGPNDHYDLQNSHVMPALIRKFDEAKRGRLPAVTLWGSGSPLREFLYVEDLADACMHLMLHYNEKGFVNVGTGKDITIKKLAEMIKQLTGFGGEILWDETKPDGTPRKLLDLSKLTALGWQYTTSLEGGLKKTYDDYLLRFSQ
jgi:GDP-L-fucose synthase